MKKFIVICGLLASNFSFGADWAYIGTGGGADFYIDKSSYNYNKPDKTIDVWVKTQRKRLFSEEYYTPSKSLTKYSCKTRESKLLADVEYNIDGTVLRSNTKPSGQFEIIFPDTIAESILVASCLSDGGGFLFPKYIPEFVDLKKLGYQEKIKAP